MEKQLTVELNGVKYLLFEIPVLDSNSKKIDAKVEKYEGIFQGVGKVHRSFWGDGYVICNVLIPEKNAVAFSRDILI